MKKALALLLAAFMLMSMVACGNTETPEETTTEEPLTGFLVPNPMEKPIYTLSENPSNTEIRQMAVKAMRDMLSIQWSTEKAFAYNKQGAVSWKDYKYYPDTIYAGLPYADGQTNIYVWYEYYSARTGKLRMEGDGQWLNDVLGNTCAGSLMWGWSAVCHTLTGSFINYNMTVKHGCLPVGDYEYDTNIDSFHDQQTSDICAKNGMDRIMEAYAQVKMADAVTSSTSDHTMMAVEDAHVERSADGKIDPQKSYLIIQDQYAGDGDNFFVKNEEGNNVSYTARIDFQINFLSLFQMNYIPVTNEVLTGAVPYEKAKVEFATTDGQCETLDDMLSGAFTSNYPMCMLKVKATNEKGKTTSVFHYYFDRMDVGAGKARYYRISGDRLDVESALAELPEGTYTVTAEVTASTGEVFTPVSVQYTR